MTFETSFVAVGEAERLIRLRHDNPAGAERELLEIYDDIVGKNREWIKWLSGALRQKNALVDCVMLGEDGRVENYWASFSDYQNMEIPPDMPELFRAIEKDGKMHYMVTPHDSSMIFYDQSQQETLQSLRSFQPHQNIGVAASDGQVIGTPIRMAYIERISAGKENPLGQAALKSRGMARGNLGLWAISKKSKPQLGFVKNDRAEWETVGYAPRVYMDREAFRKPVYLTSIPMSELVSAGGLPMNRTREGYPRMERVEVANRTGNFIVDSFIAFAGYDGGTSPSRLLVRFNGYRPWRGEIPRHG